MGGWTYIARCRDASLYVGSTSYADVQTRIDEHNDARYQGYTANRRPVVLAWSRWFEHLPDAHAMERQLKGWSRAKKLALIREDIDRLKTFAKRPSVRTALLKDRNEQAPGVRVTGRNLRRVVDDAQSIMVRGSLRSHLTMTTKDTPRRHPEMPSKADESGSRHPEVRAKRATKDE